MGLKTVIKFSKSIISKKGFSVNGFRESNVSLYTEFTIAAMVGLGLPTISGKKSLSKKLNTWVGQNRKLQSGKNVAKSDFNFFNKTLQHFYLKPKAWLIRRTSAVSNSIQLSSAEMRLTIHTPRLCRT